MVILMKNGKPYVYGSFRSAAEYADPNDIIYETEKEYRAPDYNKISELEKRIKNTSRFSNKRTKLECELRLLMIDSLKFENRKKGA